MTGPPGAQGPAALPVTQEVLSPHCRPLAGHTRSVCSWEETRQTHPCSCPGPPRGGKGGEPPGRVQRGPGRVQRGPGRLRPVNSTSNTAPLRKKPKSGTDNLLFSRWEKERPASLRYSPQKPQPDICARPGRPEGAPTRLSRWPPQRPDVTSAVTPQSHVRDSCAALLATASARKLNCDFPLKS